MKIFYNTIVNRTGLNSYLCKIDYRIAIMEYNYVIKICKQKIDFQRFCIAWRIV